MITASSGAQYVYDALGQRVEKTGGSNPAETIYFGGKAIALHNPTSGAWTDLIDGNGAMIAEVAGTQTATPEYRLLDHLGSLVVQTDNSGNVTGTNVFLPFGQLVSSTTSDSFQFTGLPQDTENSSSHAGFRNVSTTQGRWTRPDPYNGSYDIANPQSFNRYVYALNNPLGFTDPSGLDCVYDEGGNVTILQGDCASETDSGYYVDCDGCLMGATSGQVDQNGTLTLYGTNGDQLGIVAGFTDPLLVITTVTVYATNNTTMALLLGASNVGLIDGATSTPICYQGGCVIPGGPALIKPSQLKKIAKLYSCGSSPTNNVLNWTLEGAGKGLLVGGVTGGITGTVLGTPVGGVLGAIAGGVIDGAVGGATGAIWGSVASLACSLGGAY